ncbi:hypothetical protein AA18895_2466 [Acetobacter ghanensis DSM 18895]|uniref:TonB-dependent receptor plug domain-containing protein n=1 Tax=Acetobacter ghanensis TaxID=431306 RepID=UPI001E61DF02|nr:TonB-dependent receptor plug domain-containing protein [Acetobacter ghanensis]GBQ52327.1 hypothetical protein AA18895_2466 [Acetobacter ghanensis DSM 18895]
MSGLALSALVAMGSAAHAGNNAASSASASPAALAPSETPPPGDIVVTAEKKETTLQKAPLAITALTSDTLSRSNITQLIDMNGFVPGLTVANSGSFVRVVSIRGIGYEASDNLSAEPGTSFHIDGVYVVSPYALQQDFLDLQRVEVLRGPQGTVFGQSATGGIVNAITERPDTKGVHGSAQVEYGNYNLVRATGMFGMVAATGIRSLATAGIDGSRKNLLLVAVSLGAGLVPTLSDFFAAAPPALAPFTLSGVLLEIVTAIILNLFLRGKVRLRPQQAEPITVSAVALADDDRRLA